MTLNKELDMARVTVEDCIERIPNRFDLVPTEDPIARRWELQASSVQELHDWIDALREARKLALAQ